MYCWKCSTENPYSKFCFSCAFPLAANLDALLFDRIVEPFDNAAFGEFLIRVENNDFVVRKNRFEADSRKTVDPIIVESAYAANSTYTGNAMTNVGASRCILSNNGKSVYLRQDCDTRDCTNDKSTIYGQFADNQEMLVANNRVIDSGIGFSWIPLMFDNSVLYAASSKLVCK